MKCDRRFFLKSSGLAMVGLGFAPGFFTRAIAARQKENRKVVVALFQRGGADGLSMVPPIGDPRYYELGPTLALARPGQGRLAALPLDDPCGLHPALGALKRLWDGGSLALVHAVGSPKSTRSHFDAQDFMEAGTPGVLAHDGWLNRALQVVRAPAVATFRAVALQPNMPRSLLGAAPAVAMGSISDFKLKAGQLSSVASTSFESLYAGAVDLALRQTGGETFDALRMLQSTKLEEMGAQNGAEYPNSPL